MADIFDAIAHPVRRTILAGLLDGPATPERIAASLALEKPEASRHLGVLRRAGIVIDELTPEGKVLRLDAAALADIESWLSPFLESAAVASPGSLFAAWSGADAGSSIGRAVAERSHQVRSVIQDASELAKTTLPKAVGRRAEKSRPNGS